MEWIAAACALGIPAGFLLLWRIPTCRPANCAENEAVSVIIPARDEERNLPALLNSLRQSNEAPAEVLVIDDGSKDRTAFVAEAGGARVLQSDPLPRGWTGKTWACHQGAFAAASDVFLFLDADTFFSPDGYTRIVDSYCRAGDMALAISVLPYHVVKKPYEELSLFFNLLMAMGAGGFGPLSKPRLFGQSLLISRDLYSASGGHETVSDKILENFALASRIRACGGACLSLGGRGLLNFRMFPDGLKQLCEGWTKAFADGASGAAPAVLLVSIFWVSTLCSASLLSVMTTGALREYFLVLYCAFALQLYWFARQIGTFSPLTCLLYPIPLCFYFGVFGQSLYRKVFRRTVTWRGRRL